MRTFVLLLLAFSFATSYGQKTIFKKYESDELKDIRDVSIHLPKGYDKDTISNYPLAIVLDGHRLFDLYVGTANHFAATDNAPKQIVVGINMEDTRNKDASFNIADSKLTPTSRLFYRFLRDELIPFIEANYKTSPFLTIVGEGASANLATHFLKEKNPIFNAYICLNPTYAQDIVKQFQGYNINQYATVDNTFYYYIAGSPFASEEKLKKTEALGKLISSIKIDNFNTIYDDFKGSKNSSSIVAQGMARAFGSVFEIFSGITPDEYDKKLKDLSPPDAIAYLETKYLDIEFLFGANIGIRQKDVFAIEDIILEKEDGDYLDDFGNMILNLYPTSEMGNYYLGRYYESGNDFKAALEQYRLGYGKMNPADPNADLFYRNVQRILQKQ